MVDINELFKETLKKEKKASDPKVFMLQVQQDPVHSTTNPDVFKVIGVRMDTNERVAVIAVKSSAGQAVPKAGDLMRADKVERSPQHPGAPVFKAKYFHTYDQNSFCLNAVMQPLPVRTTPGSSMVGAQVIAYDPKSSGTILNGSEVQTGLSASILQHLKQWEAEESSGITHDMVGKPIWGKGANRGLTPMVTVRFADQSFKVFGAGAMLVDPSDKQKGVRFPTDKELLERIEKTQGVVTLNTVMKNLIAAGTPVQELQKVDIAVVPGLVINVGRDKVTSNEKISREYYSVPQAYEIQKDGGGSFAGHRETFIHVKMTRTNKFAVVDTVPVPGGKASAKVPLFSNEIERIEARKNLAAGVPDAAPDQVIAAKSAQAPQSPAMTREKALELNDFPDDKASEQPLIHEQNQQAAVVKSTPVIESQEFNPAEYDLEGLDSDVQIIEQLGTGLDNFDDVDDLLKQAEALSAQRHAPRMG